MIIDPVQHSVSQPVPINNMKSTLIKSLNGGATVLLLSFAKLGLAADEVAKAAPRLAEDNLAGNLIQTTLGLMFILALIGGAAWLMKRYGNIKVGAQGRMKIIGALSLGTRERVVLLEVGNKQLVVGIAPGHITTLHVLDEPIPEPVTGAKTGNFADRLQALLKGEHMPNNNKSR